MNLYIKHNTMTGEDYMAVEDNRYDYHQEIARAAYTDMLHDTERNQLYEVGLKKAIKKIHSQGREAYVLDIGTGSGLLSMMAYRNGADKITACEAFTPMADCAFKVINNNSMGDKIDIIKKVSTKMTVGEGCDMPRRANILVTEVYDTELIGEGAIPTFEHAHRVLLEDDCIVIPSFANMYIQCVNSELVRNWNVFKNIKLNDIQTIDGSSNEIVTPDEILKCPGISGVHDLQLDQVSEKDFTSLFEPIHVFKFDYTGKSAIVKTGHSSQIISALSSGSCDGIFMWWDLEMTPDDSDVILSCAPRWAHPTPSNMQWRDHWMQAIYYPLTPTIVEKGKDYQLDSFHDEYSLWFDINVPQIQSISSNIKENCPPLCNCGCHLLCCRTRIGMLNDHKRLSKYVKSMKKCINKNTICLSISNGSFLPLIAAKLGAKTIFVLEDNHLCKYMIETYIKANSITSIIFIEEKDLVQAKIFKGFKIDLVVAEPYFMQSTLPWDDLYYAYVINKITNHLSDNVIIIPKECHLKGIGAEFKDLHKIRSVLETCEGFKMLSFDSLIMASSKKVDEKTEPHPLWEYPAKPITNEFTINSFNVFKDPTKTFISRKIDFSKTIDFIKYGSEFNGVALWMDYNLDDEFYIINGLTSEPQVDVNLNWYYHCRQGLHLIDNPKKISTERQLTYSFKYQPKTGCIDLDFTVI